MSWQDDAMIEQEQADALFYMGEAEWRDMYTTYEKVERKVGRPRKSEEHKKQKRREYSAKYWATHREQISEKRKKKYQENRDKILERNKRWLQGNKEKWNEYQREYRKRKKESLDKPGDN